MMLVVAPTRELAMQSQTVLEDAGKHFKIRSVCVYGGVPKYEQRKALREGAEGLRPWGPTRRATRYAGLAGGVSVAG